MALILLCLYLPTGDPRGSLAGRGLFTTRLDHPVAGKVGAPSAPKSLGPSGQQMTVTPRQAATFGGCWLFNIGAKNQ